MLSSTNGPGMSHPRATIRPMTDPSNASPTDHIDATAALVQQRLGAAVRVNRNGWGGHDYRVAGHGMVRSALEDETVRINVFDDRDALAADARLNNMPAAVIADVICAMLT